MKALIDNRLMNEYSCLFNNNKKALSAKINNKLDFACESQFATSFVTTMYLLDMALYFGVDYFMGESTFKILF